MRKGQGEHLGEQSKKIEPRVRVNREKLLRNMMIFSQHSLDGRTFVRSIGGVVWFSGTQDDDDTSPVDAEAW